MKFQLKRTLEQALRDSVWPWNGLSMEYAGVLSAPGGFPSPNRTQVVAVGLKPRGGWESSSFSFSFFYSISFLLLLFLLLLIFLLLFLLPFPLKTKLQVISITSIPKHHLGRGQATDP